jgi:hypothetical protein
MITSQSVQVRGAAVLRSADARPETSSFQVAALFIGGCRTISSEVINNRQRRSPNPEILNLTKQATSQTKVENSSSLTVQGQNCRRVAPSRDSRKQSVADRDNSVWY